MTTIEPQPGKPFDIEDRIKAKRTGRISAVAASPPMKADPCQAGNIAPS